MTQLDHVHADVPMSEATCANYPAMATHRLRREPNDDMRCVDCGAVLACYSDMTSLPRCPQRGERLGAWVAPPGGWPTLRWAPQRLTSQGRP